MFVQYSMSLSTGKNHQINYTEGLHEFPWSKSSRHLITTQASARCLEKTCVKNTEKPMIYTTWHLSNKKGDIAKRPGKGSGFFHYRSSSSLQNDSSKTPQKSCKGQKDLAKTSMA